MDRIALIRAGRGEIKADLVVRGGTLVNVVSGEIYPADVAVLGERIVAIGDVAAQTGPQTRVIDASGRYLAPGLFDGHLHIECSKLSVTSFAKAVLPCGTTSIVSGLDQVLVVAGLAGAREFLDEAAASPLKIFWGAPCKTPYTIPTSTVGHYFRPSDHAEAQRWPECVGVWETVREFIQELDADVLEALAIAERNRLPVFGCAPMAAGDKLTSYLCAGIRLDHESYSAIEMLEKLRNGMFVLIRESSVAHFLDENIRLVTQHCPQAARRVSFCTDDVVASDVLARGHVDNMVRMAIAAGVRPIEAIQMATINGAEAYRLDHLVGSISPGRFADILLVDAPESFRVEAVIAKGRLVAEGGRMTVPLEPPARSPRLTRTLRLDPLAPDELAVRRAGPDGRVKVLAMAVSTVVPFVRKRRDVTLRVAGGVVLPDTDEDVLYVTVVERYGKTRNRPVAFVSGFGLKHGAMASSTAPDDNNIVCIGTSPAEMAFAINRLIEAGGGQVVVRDGKVVEFLALPIGGIVADLEPAAMAAKEKSLDDAARALGCTLPWPFMYMFFLPITAIPDYAITDLGAVDCNALTVFDPVLGAA
jgi:adenine deaminase